MSLHLIKSKSLFLHIPKTGGTWIEEALKAAAVEVENPGAIAEVTWRHSLLSHYRQSYGFSFTFVRHPLDWYESWWKFQSSGSWPEHEPGVWHPQRVLGRCASNTFSEFINRCIEHEPAYVTRMYEWYIGPPGFELVDFVGRYEHLADDLVRVLRLAAEEFDEEALRRQPPANVSITRYGAPAWEDEQKARILALEAPTINRFWSTDVGIPAGARARQSP